MKDHLKNTSDTTRSQGMQGNSLKFQPSLDLTEGP